MTYQIDRERSLRDAFASAEMEGFQITKDVERNARRILRGEITKEDYIREMMKKASALEKS